MTDGGDGVRGYIYSDDEKEMISKRNSGSGNGRFGKEVSSITREKIGTKNKDKKEYNNGIVNKKFLENDVPLGWVLGRLKTNKKCFNNGKIDKFFILGCEPKGWKLGKISQAKENHINFGKSSGSSNKILYNNGVEQKMFESDEKIPVGFNKGRLEKYSEKQRGENNGMHGRKGSASGKRWYNNGIKESYFEEGKQAKDWVLGRLPKKEKR